MDPNSWNSCIQDHLEKGKHKKPERRTVLWF